MKRFEVWVKTWNKEHNAHTMKVAGVFNNFVCAKFLHTHMKRITRQFQKLSLM